MNTSNILLTETGTIKIGKTGDQAKENESNKLAGGVAESQIWQSDKNERHADIAAACDIARDLISRGKRHSVADTLSSWTRDFLEQYATASVNSLLEVRLMEWFAMRALSACVY